MVLICAACFKRLRINIHMHTSIQTHMHTNIHTRACTQIHEQTHTHTHTHKHTHARTCTQMPSIIEALDVLEEVLRPESGRAGRDGLQAR
jgi:hypothetical protein